MTFSRRTLEKWPFWRTRKRPIPSTRGIHPHEENRVPELIIRAYEHDNAHAAYW